MVHKFKFGARRYCYDSESGTLHLLDELSYKMLDYIEIPPAPECPSALRYDLAKYDSADISEAFDKMAASYHEGKLFTPDADYTVTVPEKTVVGAALTESENGYVITEGNDDIDDRLTQLDVQIKALAKSGGKTPFAPVVPFVHTFGCCKECFARRICSLKNPGKEICALECKRVEAELAL